MENETNKKSDVVSHQQAWGIILGLSDDDGDDKRFEIMNRYIAQQESRDNHLEEAAELLRRAEGYERRGDLETQDWHQLMRVDIPAWYDRDQALSAPTAESAHPAAKSSPSDDNSPGLAALIGAAQDDGRIPVTALGTYSCPRCGLATPHRHDDPAPTAESGKDSACYCNQYQSSDIPCPPGKCQNAPPAPVAEAPERVTHAFAHLALGRLNHGEQWDGDFELMRRYIDQQEQSEREVAADTAPPKPGWNRGEFINPQNASEAHVRAIEALESGKVTQAVAWLCDAVRLLAHEPKT